MPALAVRDDVVTLDRHAGWKFCTPYEKERQKVTRVQVTMITAQSGQSQAIRNVA